MNELVRDISFLVVRSASYIIFCRFFRLLRFYEENIFFALENGRGNSPWRPLPLQYLQPCIQLHYLIPSFLITPDITGMFALL